MTGLRNRGVRDILIACCDGLAGFEDAIHAAFPATVVQTCVVQTCVVQTCVVQTCVVQTCVVQTCVVQTCVVHMIRNSLRPVARRAAAAVTAELRKIYTAVDADTALEALAAFSDSPLGRKYPQAIKVRENAWDRFTPFLAFSPGVRKLLYTTDENVKRRGGVVVAGAAPAAAA